MTDNLKRTPMNEKCVHCGTDYFEGCRDNGCSKHCFGSCGNPIHPDYEVYRTE